MSTKCTYSGVISEEDAMGRKTATTTLLVLVCSAIATAGGPTWVKWDAARQQAGGSLQPIFVYSTVTEKADGC